MLFYSLYHTITGIIIIYTNMGYRNHTHLTEEDVVLVIQVEIKPNEDTSLRETFLSHRD